MTQKKRQRKFAFRKYPQDQLERVYRFIDEYMDAHGPPPSKREVAAKFETHHSTIGFWYGLMEDAKMVTLYPGTARGIKLLPLP